MVKNSFEKEMEDFVENLPLAKIGLQYLKRATNNNILSKITNLGKGRKVSGGIAYGEFQDPSLNPAYRLTSENAEAALDVNNPDFELSAALDDPDKRVWTSHELSHLGMGLLRKSGLIDNKTYLEYEKARKANESELSEDFYRVSKAHLQIQGGEQRALELQGRPFEGESKVRFRNKKGELEVFELPSLDRINNLANTWLEKNANDPSNKSLNYGNALKEEVNFIKKEQASKDLTRNPEKINYIKDNTMPMIPPLGIKETNIAEIRKLEEESLNPEFLPPQKETDLSTYAKGGDIMPMEQQMQMFAIGGLDDDGMSRDPISGNEIPPGSMANEVRDDVDAKLSDGEYVVPANVVRFFGVKFFEDLRTQAMQGLSNMEANGRIGGEPVPSDMPMQDQMAEVMPDVSDGEMEMLQGLMNEGGYVRGYAPGGAVVPKDVDLENPTPFNPSPFLTVGGSYLSPNNPNVTPDPNLPPTTMPVTPIPESGISFVTMVNPATGDVQVIQFKGGDPVDANAYNQLISSGFFIQGSPELAQYKQKIEQDNRESDKEMGGDKPKSINDLLSGDLYGDMSLGLGAKLAGSVINKAFPTKSNQQVLDYIIDNFDPVTGESRFPPSGRGIPLRDAAGNIVLNPGGTPRFQTDKNGFILRSEGKDGPRNVAKEEVARILAITKIRKANTNSKGVLKNEAYRDALKKAGLAEGVGLTTKFVNPADWYKSAAGIKAIANVNATATQIVTDDLEATEKKFTPTYDTKSKTYKYGSDDKDDGFVVTDPKTGKKKDYRFGVVKDPTDLSAFDTTTILPPEDNDNNNNNTSGGSNNNNSNDDNDAGYEDGGDDSYSSDYEKQEDPDFGLMNKGGIVKKRKKKKTKRY